MCLWLIYLRHWRSEVQFYEVPGEMQCSFMKSLIIRGCTRKDLRVSVKVILTYIMTLDFETAQNLSFKNWLWYINFFTCFRKYIVCTSKFSPKSSNFQNQILRRKIVQSLLKRGLVKICVQLNRKGILENISSIGGTFF